MIFSKISSWKVHMHITLCIARSSTKL